MHKRSSSSRASERQAQRVNMTRYHECFAVFKPPWKLNLIDVTFDGIAQKGVAAGEFIPSGCFIVAYIGDELDYAEGHALFMKGDTRYLYFVDGGSPTKSRYINAERDDDSFARRINHSDTRPRCTAGTCACSRSMTV